MLLELVQRKIGQINKEIIYLKIFQGNYEKKTCLKSMAKYKTKDGSV